MSGRVTRLRRGTRLLTAMNWLDISIIAIFVLAIVIEAKRGFGKALFDLAALLLAIFALSRIEPALRTAKFEPHEQAAIYAALFVVLGGILIVIGRLAHQATLISAQPFDPMLGGMLGIGAGIVLCYGIVHTMALTGGPHSLPPTLSCSLLGKEFITFDTYHKVLYVLQHFDDTRTSPS